MTDAAHVPATDARPSPRWTDYIAVDDLVPDPRNPKAHDDDLLDASLRRFQFTEQPMIDERTGMLIAGHGRRDLVMRTRDAVRAGVDGVEVPEGIVVDDDGTWRIPVQRGWASTNDDEAGAYLVASNATSEKGGWYDDRLADLLDSTARLSADGLAGTGYTDAELNDLLDAAAAAATDEDPSKLDDVPDVPESPTTTRGDVWLLGPHRLICGTATDRAVLDRVLAGDRPDLVWTDPPYGVDYVGKTPDALTIDNDDIEGLDILLHDAFGNAAAVCRPGAVWFVAAPSGPQFLLFAVELTTLGIWRGTMAWVKDRFVLGHSDYHYRYESIFFGWVPGAAHHPTPDRTPDTVWEFPRPSRSTEHPTMKPVALIEKAIGNHSNRGEIVLDMFCGSGSTLMAADHLERIARIGWIDEGYCDVICRRYQEVTGTTPILEATGEPHDFTS